MLTVVVAPFEEAILEEDSFDLGVSATAFHRLEEDPALKKVAKERGIGKSEAYREWQKSK